jgi:alkylhydroperoxidase family enzyme
VKNYTIYLIHITPRYRHAQHYLGITRDGRPAQERFEEHVRGAGAVLTRAARKAGCSLFLARVWENAEFGAERKMKGRSLRPLCPICRTNP